jgi:GNAT superfamily N-acetyltransferase
MTSTYELRVARHGDVPALSALIDASVRGLGPPHYSAAQVEAGLAHVFGVDTQLVDDGTYFLIEAFEEERRSELARPVACGGWSARRTLFGGDRHKSGVDERLDPGLEPARIRAFFVHPDHARRGLGRQLFEACELAAAAAGFTVFELMATLPGVPLYAALGFVGLERVPVPTPAGVSLDCLRMRRPITRSDVV